MTTITGLKVVRVININREDFTNVMVSHCATALTMMACRNINEPTIRRDIMRIMNRPSTDLKEIVRRKYKQTCCKETKEEVG
jgi:hypothetical protein